MQAFICDPSKGEEKKEGEEKNSDVLRVIWSMGAMLAIQYSCRTTMLQVILAATVRYFPRKKTSQNSIFGTKQFLSVSVADLQDFSKRPGPTRYFLL